MPGREINRNINESVDIGETPREAGLEMAIRVVYYDKGTMMVNGRIMAWLRRT